ncbi:MAG: ubiquitin-like domain-containing protein, partial [bacterium]|nr:ubiquitin-like domain-containing protein [bacterium]
MWSANNMLYKFYPSRLITLAAAGLAVALLSFGLYSHVQAASTTESSDKLITVHDGGQERVILTSQDTLGQALVEAGISLDSHDTVEPAADSKLVASSYQVNIYRAKPVIVIDDSVQTRVMTSHKSGRDIAKAAGVTLRDEDTTEMKLSMDLVSSGPATQLIVHRAIEFSLDLYGDKSTAYTQAKTVGEMLDEKGIKLTDKDGVTPNQSTPVKPGMTIKVWRDGKQTVTKKEKIKYTVRTIKDVDRPASYK